MKIFFKPLILLVIFFLQINYTQSDNMMKNYKVLVNGISIQVKEYYSEKEPIVFLHYGGANLEVWRKTVPFFINKYRLILVDLRGHGKSDKPLTGNDIDSMAADIKGVLEYLKIKNTFILGSSLGAEVAISVAANYPEMVKAVVCDGAFYNESGEFGIFEGTDEEFRAITEERTNLAVDYYSSTFSSKSGFLENSKKEYEAEGIWNDDFKAVIEYGIFEREDGKFSGSWQNYAVQEYIMHYFNYKFETYYRRIECPLLHIVGNEVLKNQRKKEIVYKFKQESKNFTILEEINWKHPYGWLINPELVCPAILNFFGKI